MKNKITHFIFPLFSSLRNNSFSQSSLDVRSKTRGLKPTDACASAYRFAQSGRSMVEMLGTLAIIGILSITAVLGFNYAINKARANRIYNDIKLAHASVYTRTSAPYEWTSVEFTPAGGHPLYMRRDLSRNDFVLVESVTQDVCDILSDMADDGREMVLYYTDNTPMTCDEETQDIVASFSGKIQQIACNTIEDCPADFNGFCNTQDKVCEYCPMGQIPDATGEACVDLTCDEDTETLCATETNAWCCPNTLLCGEQKDECVPSTGWCSYDFAEPKVSATYDCAYTFKEPIVSATYDCAYTLTDATLAGVATIGLKEEKGCGTGLYCHLRYSDTSCGTTAPANTAVGTTIYGSCSPMNSSYTGCTMTVDQSNVLSVEKSCGEGLYCHLRYSDTSCGTTASADTKNRVIYGSCSPMNSSYTGCTMTVDQSNVLDVITPCPSSQYCHLKYKGQTCTTAPADMTGVIYGVCLAPNSSSTVCPPPELD